MKVPPWCCSLTSTPSRRKEVALPRIPLMTFPLTTSGRMARELPVGGRSAAPGVSSARRKKPRPLSGRSVSWRLVMTVPTVAESVLRSGVVVWTSTVVVEEPIWSLRSSRTIWPTCTSTVEVVVVWKPGRSRLGRSCRRRQA